MSDLKIRRAEEKDVETIFELIKELAEFEKLSHEVIADLELLRKSLFEEKQAQVLIAETESKVAGFALYFYNYSTFLGRKGIYLEDLFVRPQFRSQGYGKKILEHLISCAQKEHCGRVEWSVLKWNQKAIDFYKSMGAQPLEEWDTYRVTL